MVCMPTRVADVSCHAWSPVSRKSSDIVADLLLDVFRSMVSYFNGELKLIWEQFCESMKSGNLASGLAMMHITSRWAICGCGRAEKRERQCR
jgi:hypothetical protein